MTDILKLAEQAGIPFNKYGLVGCDSCETDIDDALQNFATLIREQHTKELIGAGVEPVAWDVYVACDDHGYLSDDLDDPQLVDDCTNSDAVVTPLFTSEALAARVVQARAEEREACASVCDEKHYHWRWDNEPDSASGPRECAIAIRARGGECTQG